MWIEIKELDGSYAGDNSRTAETELLEIELGHRAAFDLLHLDDVMFGGWCD
jgi:hypothetical protein